MAVRGCVNVGVAIADLDGVCDPHIRLLEVVTASEGEAWGETDGLITSDTVTSRDVERLTVSVIKLHVGPLYPALHTQLHDVNPCTIVPPTTLHPLRAHRQWSPPYKALQPHVQVGYVTEGAVVKVPVGQMSPPHTPN